jgi:hypothetical protein
MKNISFPVFFILLLCMALAWWMNRYLQLLIRPRDSFSRLMLYLLTGMAMVFAGVYVAVRVILWLFPPHL